jgi:hypothetical protein
MARPWIYPPSLVGRFSHVARDVNLSATKHWHSLPMSIYPSRRLFCTTALGGLVANPALGQDTKGKTSDPLSVELTGVVLPLANGQALVSYLFCVILIQMGDAASAFYFRENQFLLRDALVRIGSRSPIPVGAAPNTYDRVAVTRLVQRAVAAIRPSTRLVRVSVVQGEFMRR